MKRGDTIYFVTKRGHFRRYILLSDHRTQFNAVTCRTQTGSPVIRSSIGLLDGRDVEDRRKASLRAKWLAKYQDVINAYESTPDYNAVADALRILPVAAWNKIRACKNRGLLK